MTTTAIPTLDTKLIEVADYLLRLENPTITTRDADAALKRHGISFESAASSLHMAQILVGMKLVDGSDTEDIRPFLMDPAVRAEFAKPLEFTPYTITLLVISGALPKDPELRAYFEKVIDELAAADEAKDEEIDPVCQCKHCSSTICPNSPVFGEDPNEE